MRKCSQCGAESWVTDSRTTGEYIRRRYRCDGPEHHRFTTREYELDVLVQPRPDIVFEEVEQVRAALTSALKEIKKAVPASRKRLPLAA